MTKRLAIGLMSGTSLDGIDAALIETDGRDHVRPLAFVGTEYTADARRALAEGTRVALGMTAPVAAIEIVAAEQIVTTLHAAVVGELLRQARCDEAEVAVIGFHGQTILHRPAQRWTWQIGDGAKLAALTAIPVVDQFRLADVAAGGQGAPLLPVYHRALCAGVPRPVAILNLGGVGNITWVGAGEDELVAFDTGPANSLIDQWVEHHTGRAYDADGALAASGSVSGSVLDALLDNPWFDQPPPKSLDRHDFTDQPARGLSLADGATTLTRFTAETVALALRQLGRPERLIVAGGGRRNPTLMRMIGEACGLAPEPIEALDRNGDATEAEGFAYMAVRSLDGLPISFPGTTGAPRPLTGGTFHRPPAEARTCA